MPKTCPVCATIYPDTDAFCPKDGTTLRMDEAAGSLVGSVIADRYLVKKLLGEGGMGQVYLAEHVRLPQQAAIKVLHASMLKDTGAIARFNREAANAARIEHDRVARVFDFGETGGGLVYLAMEFVPGSTLREVMDSAKPMPATRVANLTYQIAEGLDAAHRISIVHRDLKPDNVLVITDAHGLDRCKVVDFGIAKVFDDSENMRTQLTQAGAIIGTPEFMSPEQVLGEQLDARSDVYSLAILAFEMFTGVLPFVATTPERSLTARLISDPQTLHDGAPSIEWPLALQQAFDRALAREPEQRTSSALEFAEAVVQAVEEWTGVGVLRGRTPLSTASVPTPLSAAAVSAKARTVATASPSASAKRSRTPMLVGGVLLAVAVAVGAYAMSGTDATAPTAGVVDSTDLAVLPAPDSPGAGMDDAGASGGASTAAGDARTSGAREPALVPERPAGATSNGTASSAPTTPAPTTPAPNTTPGAATTTPGGTATEADRAEARRTLARLRKQILDADPAETRSAIPQLEALLPRLSSLDSTWVYVSLAISHATVDNVIAACVALRNADRRASSEEQLTMVLTLKGADFFKQCL